MSKVLKLVFSFAFLSVLVHTTVSHATSLISETLVINAIQLRGEATTGQSSVEVVEVSNTSDAPVDITGWCVLYAPSTSLSFSVKGCFQDQSSDWLHYFLPPTASTQFITSEYATIHPEVVGAFSMVSGLANSAGQLKLQDYMGVDVDHVGWGVGSLSETSPVVIGSQTIGFSRLDQADSGDNSKDFVGLESSLMLQQNEVIEVEDICHNLDGIQDIVPEGYQLDEGNCAVDVCPNIDGLQDFIPEGYVSVGGGCAKDVCENVEGLQEIAPEGMKIFGSKCVEPLLLLISELLPNPVGEDAGGEFVEIYNPNDVDVDLAWYKLQVGLSYNKEYSFVAGSMIDAHEYAVWYDSELGYGLTNTSGSARIVFIDDTIIDTADPYIEAKDDTAWANIGGTWQYTNIPTPGAENEEMLVESAEPTSSGDTFVPCGPGKYRNPLTNRCKSLTGSANDLKPCDLGQYRNPATNRCKSLTASAPSLVPCKPGYARNPDTNRCRKTSSSNTLVPCGVGRERNPLTNRCRKIPGTDAQIAGVQTETPFEETQSSYAMNSLLVVSGIGAVGYGVYEWRSEFARGLRRVAGLLLKR